MSQRIERTPFVTVSQKAQGLISGEINPLSLMPPKLTSPMTAYEAGRIYGARKDDVYALLGVHVSLFVDAAHKEAEQFPPSGLSLPEKDGGRIEMPVEPFMDIYRKDGISPFFYANMMLRNRLKNIRHEVYPDESKRELFRDVGLVSQAWGDFYDNNVLGTGKRLLVAGMDIRNAWKFTDSAIDNAVNFMTGLSSLVPQVAEIQNFDPKENNTLYGEILENSYYIPHAFASTGLEEFSEKLVAVVHPDQIEPGFHVEQKFPENGERFDPEVFRIGKKGDGKWRLVLNPELMPARNIQALKCPAIINLLGESALAKLWNLNTRAARTFYPLMEAA